MFVLIFHWYLRTQAITSTHWFWNSLSWILVCCVTLEELWARHGNHVTNSGWCLGKQVLSKLHDPNWPAAPTPECFIKLFQMPNNCMCYRMHFSIAGWLCLVRCGLFLLYSSSLESWELRYFPESLHGFSCIYFLALSKFLKYGQHDTLQS